MTLFFGALWRAGLFFAAGLLAVFAGFRALLFFAAVARDLVERLGFFDDLRLADLREEDFFGDDFFDDFFDALEDFDDFEDFFDGFFDDFFEDDFFDFFEAAIRFSCSPVSVIALPGVRDSSCVATWLLEAQFRRTCCDCHAFAIRE